MGPELRNKLYLFVILILFINFFAPSFVTGSELDSTWISKPSYNLATPLYSAKLVVKTTNKQVLIQIRVQSKNSVPFSFGDSQFIINIDTALLNINKAVIVKRGPWDRSLSPDFEPLSITSSLKTVVIRVKTRNTNSTSTGVLVPVLKDTLLAEIALPVKNCNNLSVTWSPRVSQGDIKEYHGIDISAYGFFGDATAMQSCTCTAGFTGLDSTYCSSSYLSRLLPEVPGGKFAGEGVHYNSGIWYFKPFDAGPGIHTVSYILPCGDTIRKKMVIKAAPCMSTSNQDSSNGYTYLPLPQGIITDCNGEIYTTSGTDFTVIKIDTFGIKHVVAGKTNVKGYVDGDTSIARFLNPLGITIDNTPERNIYVVDNQVGGYTIRKINQKTSTVTTIAGSSVIGNGTSSDDGDSTKAKFIPAVGLAFNSSYTKLYCSESGKSQSRYRIREIDLATKKVRIIAGGLQGDLDGIGTVAKFSALGHLSCDANYLYVADEGNSKIKRIDLISGNYKVETIVGKGIGYIDGDSSIASFKRPLSASVGMNGIIYVADAQQNVIREIQQHPIRFVSTIAGDKSGASGKTDSTFSTPVATSVFVKGYIDVVDKDNNRIRRVAIADYGNKPYAGFDTSYCLHGRKDTLPYTIGTYAGPGVYKSGNNWYFNPDSVASGPGTYSICYSYNLNQCNATFCKQVIIHPKPKVNFPKDTLVCPEKLGELTIDAGTYVTYQWYKNIPANIISGEKSRFFKIDRPGVYSVLLKDKYNCTGGDTITADTLTSPVISLGNDKIICSGDSAMLKITTTSTITKVLWQDSTATIPYYAKGGGIYSVVVTDNKGCIGNDTIHVHTILPPTPIISSSPAEVCKAIVKTKAVFVPENTFTTPQLQGMVKDRDGNIYITDFQNNLIRKVDSKGNKSVYAGQGSDIFGKNVTTLKLYQPYGIAIDKEKNIYVTEVLPGIIRKITPSGGVSIFAGTYNAANFNGDGRKDTVHLSQPTSIDIDDAGNVYVTEYGKHTIRRISKTGSTEVIGDTTSSGDATGKYSSARFNKPQALTIDKGGYVYVADLNNTIKKIDPFRKTVSVYSVLPSGASANVKGLAADNHRRIFLTMNSNYSLYVIDPKDSTASYYAGSSNTSGYKDGLMTQAKFQDPEGLYIDEYGGPLYAVDKDKIRILVDTCSVDICEGSVATLDIGPQYVSQIWNNDASKNSRYLSVDKPGSNYVKVTDGNTCTFYDTILVNVKKKPTLVTSNDTIICYGDTATLSAYLNPIKPLDTLIFNFNGINISQVQGMPYLYQRASKEGIYNAAVHMENGCFYSREISLKLQKPPLLAGADKQNCTKDSVSLVAEVQGTKADYKYRWRGVGLSHDTVYNPIAIPPTVKDSVYSVIVTDKKGCKAMDTLTVHLWESPIVEISKDTNICIGGSTSINTKVNGGSGPYSYNWMPSLNLNLTNPGKPIVTPVDTTTYSVIITDAKGCKSNKASSKINVINLKVYVNVPPDSVCPQSTAKLLALAKNGSGKYRYKWSPSSGISDPDTNVTTAIGIPGAAYQVEVTDKIFQCSITSAQVKILVKKLAVNSGQDTSICLNNKALMQAKVIGAKGDVSYEWSPKGLLQQENTSQPFSDKLPIGITTFVSTITDAAGCKVTDTVSVTVNELPALLISNDTSICKSQSVEIWGKASGGKAPFIYEWTDKDGNTTSFTAPYLAKPLATQKFHVRAKDANQCFSMPGAVTINVSDLKVSVASDADTICPGSSSLIKATAINGIGKIRYRWSPIEVLNNDTISDPVALLHDNTILQVSIMDSIGCKSSASVSVKVFLLTLNAGNQKQLCIGDTTMLLPSILPSSGSYKYQWKSEMKLLNDKSFNAKVVAEKPGKFYAYLTVEDQKGCKANDSITVVVNEKPVLLPIKDTSICINQSISLVGRASGGKAPFTYEWTDKDGNTALSSTPYLATPLATQKYIVRAKDENQCFSKPESVKINVSDLKVSVTSDLDTICPGSSSILKALTINGIGKIRYTWLPGKFFNNDTISDPVALLQENTLMQVSVTDSIGCKSSASLPLQVYKIILDAGDEKQLCIGDTMLLSPTLSPNSNKYNFQWKSEIKLLNDKNFNATVIAEKPGKYYAHLDVTDAKGCKAKDSMAVVVNELPVLLASKDTSICKNQPVALAGKASGGKAPFTFEWTDMDGKANLSSAPFQVTPLLTQKYFVRAKDANQCFSKTGFFKINVSDLKVSATTDFDTVCPGSSFQLKAFSINGIGRTVYRWSPGEFFNHDTVSNPVALLHENTLLQVSVSDSIGCKSSASIPVKVSQLILKAGDEKQICMGDTLSLSPSLMPSSDRYKYQWTSQLKLLVNQEMNTRLVAEKPGKYSVHIAVINSKGCRAEDSLSIIVNPRPVADAGLEQLTICKSSLATLGSSMTASGGTGNNYSYSWTSSSVKNIISSPATSNPVIKGEEVGTVLLEVKDEKGCKDTNSLKIIINPLPDASIITNRKNLCNGDTAVLSLKPNTGNFTSNWSIGNYLVSVKDSIHVTRSGDYKVVVRNNFTTCKDSSLIQISFIDSPAQLIVKGSDFSCINTPLQLQASATGSQLTYTWKALNGTGKIINLKDSVLNYLPDKGHDPIFPQILKLRVIVKNDCKSDSIEKSIQLYPATLPAFLVNKNEIFADEEIIFTNKTDTTLVKPNYFLWKFGDNSSTSAYNAQHFYREEGSFTAKLIEENKYNCRDTAMVTIKVISNDIIYIPNVFAPDEVAENNKILKIYSHNINSESFGFSIFNRWGEVVFSSSDLTHARTTGWNGNYKNTGEEQPMGVYTYALNCILNNGKKIKKTGTITLIR